MDHHGRNGDIIPDAIEEYARAGSGTLAPSMMLCFEDRECRAHAFAAGMSVQGQFGTYVVKLDRELIRCEHLSSATHIPVIESELILSVLAHERYLHRISYFCSWIIRFIWFVQIVRMAAGARAFNCTPSARSCNVSDGCRPVADHRQSGEVCHGEAAVVTPSPEHIDLRKLARSSCPLIRPVSLRFLCDQQNASSTEPAAHEN